MSTGSSMSVLWFKGPSNKIVQLVCAPDGAINIPGLAKALKLEPRPLILNGALVDFDTRGYTSVDRLQGCFNGLGDSPDNAIPVTGEPAGATRGEAATAGVRVHVLADNFKRVYDKVPLNQDGAINIAALEAEISGHGVFTRLRFRRFAVLTEEQAREPNAECKLKYKQLTVAELPVAPGAEVFLSARTSGQLDRLVQRLFYGWLLYEVLTSTANWVKECYKEAADGKLN